MNITKELRDSIEIQRSAGVEFVTFEDLLFQIYRSKFPGDEIQFNVRRNHPGEEADLKFEEHPEAGRFWIFPLHKEGVATYPCTHYELAMHDPIEKLKELFPDGRFDYIADTLASI